MTPLELDDVTFLNGVRSHSGLTSTSTSHVTPACDTCQCLCARSTGTSSSTSGLASSSLTHSRRNSWFLRLVHRVTHSHHNPSPYSYIRQQILWLLLAVIFTLALFIALLRSSSSSSSSSGHHTSSSPCDSDGDTDNYSISAEPRDSIEHPLATTGQAFPWTDIRLPDSVRPIHYDLFLHPNLTTFDCKGSVEIWLNVTRVTNFIIIHSKDLNITEVTVNSRDQKLINVNKLLICNSLEQLYIELSDHLYPTGGRRNYTLHISFARKLEDKLEGFYISSYNESSNIERKKFLATTHFEPTSARSAFPCFDEPAMKATFSLKMVHESTHDVVFNAERQNREPYSPDGLLISVFADTVKMSTYLVAFAVCDFRAVSGRSREGVHVRVIVPTELHEQTSYALESTMSILSYFQDFFGVPYPLNKLDLIAVPDFGAGAMENWGLITFRTTLVLYNEKDSGVEAKEQVATVISHELAHQWFGNLVTMDWWSDLWLNEGFASYIENRGVDHIHPDWRMLDQFVVSTTQEALSLDCLEASHPIRASVKNPVEIEALFDVISYKKGAALIRMLENFLQLDVLRAGLTRYLRQYQFKNAKTGDLWRSLSEAAPNSSVNVTAIMERWVQQKGFPVISSKIERGKMYIGQRRFLAIPSIDTNESEIDSYENDGHRTSPSHSMSSSSSSESPYAYQWIVPITYITSKSPDSPRLVWLSQADASLNMHDGPYEWFKLNVNQTGFYRVNYDDTNWRRLIELLHSRAHEQHALSPADRSSLLDDALTFMKVSQLSADLAMNLTAYLENGERDLIPWESALKHFALLDAIMDGHALLRKYIVSLIQPTLKELGWKDDGDHLTRKLRALLLKAAVTYGDEATITVAKRRFEEWSAARVRVPPTLREVVYTTGVKYGSAKEWDGMWLRYRSSRIPSEQRILLTALSSTRSLWLLQRLLSYSLDKEQIKPQDTVQVITDVARNPDGRLLAWRFVRANWKKILASFGQGSFSMDSIISGVTFHFSRPFDQNEVATFFASVDTGSGSQAVKQSLQRIQGNIYCKKYVEHQVINWLKRKPSLRY